MPTDTPAPRTGMPQIARAITSSPMLTPREKIDLLEDLLAGMTAGSDYCYLEVSPDGIEEALHEVRIAASMGIVSHIIVGEGQ